MENKIILTEEIKEEMINISTRLYNLKHSLQFYFNCIEGEKITCSLSSISYILREYFNTTKEMYNNLEKIFGTYE